VTIGRVRSHKGGHKGLPYIRKSVRAPLEPSRSWGALTLVVALSVARSLCRPAALAFLFWTPSLPAFAAQATLPAPAQWTESKLPGEFFTVLTDAGDKEARRITFQLGQFDKSLQRRFPWIRLPQVTDAPLRVFASSDEALVRSLAPDAEEGGGVDPHASYWAPDWTRSGPHTAAVRLGLKEPTDTEPSPHRGYFRGRTTFLLGRSLTEATPSWLLRGLVTFFSETVVRDKEIQTGRMAPAWNAARTAAVLSAADFFRDGRGVDRAFDLQAGLFIHYLFLGEGGKNARLLDAALLGLSSKETAAGAQSAVSSLKALYAGFPKYAAGKKLGFLKLPLAPSVTPAAFGVSVVPLAEALLQRASVHQLMNRPVDTRAVLRQVKAADPSLARPYEIEAFLFDAEQRTTESKQAIEAALERGSSNPHLRYRLAQLQWAPKMNRALLESVRKLLTEAHQDLLRDAKIMAYLAEVLSDLGQADAALGHAGGAVKTETADAYSRMALARAQWNSRQMDAATATARQALALAQLPSQKLKVQEFLAFAAANKRAQGSGSKPWTTHSGPPPSGAFGSSRNTGGSGRVNLGQTRTDSADGAAIADCFARRDDAACARAVPALELACAEKQTTSCVSLGSLYDGGFGVARDRRKAAAAYTSACTLGDQAGCARYAVLEAQGLGVAPNAARATKTLRTLCSQKIAEGCIGLAQILRKTGFAVDRDEAQKVLNETCAAGSPEACALLNNR